MKFVIVSDTFPPHTSSGALQMADLANELVRQGHFVTVLLPSSDQKQAWKMEVSHGVRVFRFKTLKSRNVSYLQRTIAEISMPYLMKISLLRSPCASDLWDGVIWYSPSIFHGPFVKYLKKRSTCKSYLIVRDIFPEWAFDMGLLKPGFVYAFFKWVARYQYNVADVIGIQSVGNSVYFNDWIMKKNRTLEVLNNWLGQPKKSECIINIKNTKLFGRALFVYAGNIGIAQDLNVFLDLAVNMSTRSDVGFLFVGRGGEKERLQARASSLNLDNVLFFDEIPSDQISALYEQCDIGIVSLDIRHNSHNIPGKFLSYMQNGLPVLAKINPGNDLKGIIETNNVGRVCESNNTVELKLFANQLLQQVSRDGSIKARCKNLYENEFTVSVAAEQIVQALATE